MDSASYEAVSVLDEQRCWNLLGRHELGRLAVVDEGTPDIFPVNYVVDGRSVLLRTAPGSKLLDITANPAVAFEVDEHDDDFAASVVLKGVAEPLHLQSEIDAADALGLASWIPTLKYRWVRVRATNISGREFPRTPEPERYRTSGPDVAP